MEGQKNMPCEHGKTDRKSRLERVGQRNGTHISDRVLVESKRCDSAIGHVRCGARHAQMIQNDMLDSTYMAHLIQR